MVSETKPFHPETQQTIGRRLTAHTRGAVKSRTKTTVEHVGRTKLNPFSG